MNVWELFMIGLGLSMDAFAAAVAQGLQMKEARLARAVAVAGTFGLFQALMPVMGYLMGERFEARIVPIDHWIAFALLTFLGSKMLWDARDKGTPSAPGPLWLVGLATSMDALAVGVTFAFMRVAILPAAALIGMVTFSLSLTGVCLGNLFGARHEKSAQRLGGMLLMGMGVKLLLTHLLA
ncbi:MAG: manganese efflux pump MntP family protein [Clostridia bacterium]